MQQIHARYCDGRTGKTLPVRLESNDSYLHVIDGATGHIIAQWPTNTIRTDKPSSDYMILYSDINGDASLELKGKDQISKLKLRGRGLLHSRSTQIVLTVLVAIGLVLLGLMLSLDRIARYIAHKVPLETEVKVAATFHKKYLGERCGAPADYAEVENLAARLVGQDSKYLKFAVVDDPEVNAYALPGGLVVINRGILDHLDSADEFAGILAHEIAHFKNRHMTQALVRGAILTFVWQILLGQVGDFTLIDPDSIVKLLALKFDRMKETEADKSAGAMMVRARISPDGLRNFFTRQNEKEDWDIPLLSTHPSYEGRVESLKKFAVAKPTPSLTPEGWMAFKKICGDSKKTQLDQED